MAKNYKTKYMDCEIEFDNETMRVKIVDQNGVNIYRENTPWIVLNEKQYRARFYIANQLVEAYRISGNVAVAELLITGTYTIPEVNEKQIIVRDVRAKLVEKALDNERFYYQEDEDHYNGYCNALEDILDMLTKEL